MLINSTFDVIDDLGIIVWNSKNRCVTNLSYTYPWVDHYAHHICDCIANAFDIEHDAITTMRDEPSKKAIIIYHHYSDPTDVDRAIKEFALLLSMLVTKRNRYNAPT